MISRGLSAAANKAVKPIEGDTKEFAERVNHLFKERSRKARRGGQRDNAEDGERKEVENEDGRRKPRSLGGSVSEAWEGDKVEFIVDIPVWSPGCFQGLSGICISDLN